MRWRSAIALVLCFLSASATAQSPAEVTSAPAPDPIVVHAGMYLTRVPSLSLRDNKVDLVFYVWFRWRGDGVHPYESFELMNATILEKGPVDEFMVEGFHYATGRITASVTKYWDTRRYPFDDHVLEIELEDSTLNASRLVFRPDLRDTGADSDVTIAGWELGRPRAAVRTHLYDTDFGHGDLSAARPSGSRYSRLVFSIGLRRSSVVYGLKLLYGLFIAALIAISSFAIRPTNLDPRFGLSIGALFAIMASHFVVAANLPDAGQLSVVDELHVMSGAITLACILCSIVSLRLHENGRELASRRVDAGAGVVLSALLVVISWFVIRP